MVGFHDGEYAPEVVILTSLLVLVHLGIIEPDEEFIVGPDLGIQPRRGVFRKDDEIQVWVASLGRGNHAADFIDVCLNVFWGIDYGNWVLDKGHQQAVGGCADASGAGQDGTPITSSIKLHLSLYMANITYPLEKRRSCLRLQTHPLWETALELLGLELHARVGESVLGLNEL